MTNELERIEAMRAGLRDIANGDYANGASRTMARATLLRDYAKDGLPLPPGAEGLAVGDEVLIGGARVVRVLSKDYLEVVLDEVGTLGMPPDRLTRVL